MTDTPKIPDDHTPETGWHNRQRSILRLAEGGHRKGLPTKQIPHYGLCNDEDDRNE